MAGSTVMAQRGCSPAAAVAIAAIGGALELGGAAASAFSGHGARFVPFTMASAVAIARHGTTALWPSTSPSLVAALAAVAAAAILGPVGVFGIRAWLRRPPQTRRPVRSRKLRRCPCSHALLGRSTSAAASPVPCRPQAQGHSVD